MTFIRDGIVRLARSFSRKNNQVIMVRNDIRNSRPVAHERSEIEVNKVGIHNINHLLYCEGIEFSVRITLECNRSRILLHK